MFVRRKRKKKIRYNRTENGRPMGWVFLFIERFVCAHCTHTHNKKREKCAHVERPFRLLQWDGTHMRLLLSMMSADARAPFRYSIFPSGWAFIRNLGVWFFLYLPELLWNTQRIYPPKFFCFGWGLHNKAIGWSAGLHKHVMKSDWW